MKFVEDLHGQKIMWLGELEKNGTKSEFHKLLKRWEGDNRQIFVSFDVDCIRGCDMPGVSCPSPIGITAGDATRICYLAGENKNVSIVDFSELNVAIEDDLSSRLVCLMIYNFLLGITARQ